MNGSGGTPARRRGRSRLSRMLLNGGVNTLEMWMDHVGPLSGDCRVLRFDKFNLRAKWNNLPAIADNKPVNGRRPAAGAAPRRDRNEKNTLRPKGRAGKVREYESNWNRAPDR